MGDAGKIISASANSLGVAAGVFALTGNPYLAAAAFGVSFGSTFLFAPKEPSFDFTSERTLTVRQPAAFRRTIYGEVEVGSVLAFLGSTDANRNLHLATMYASHEVAGFGDLFINDELVTPDQIGGDGVVSSGIFANVARFKSLSGTDGQAADPDFVAEVPEWTGSHRLQGIAYDYARLTDDRNAFPTGRPNISRVIRGKKLYDPRDGGTRWSSNAALVIRDYLTDAKLGAGYKASAIDEDSFAAEANICDEFVDVQQNSESVTVDAATNVITVVTSDRILRWFRGDRMRVSANSFPGGVAADTDYFIIPVGVYGDSKSVKLAASYADALAGTEIDLTSAGSVVVLTRTGVPRYTADVMITSDETPKDVIAKLLSSCAGRLYFSGGLWRLQVGAWRPPTVPAVTEDDLRGPITVTTQVSLRDRVNAVKGRYISPLNDWEPADYPPVQSVAFAIADGQTLFDDLDLPCTVRPQSAQRIAKIELLRRRQAITTALPAKLTLLGVRAGDTIPLDNARYGWTGKVFEVTEWGLASEQIDGAPYLGPDLVLRETDASVYDWATSEEQIVDPAPNTTLPSAFTAEPPDSIAVTSGSAELAIASDGTVVPQMRIAWTAPAAAFVRGYEVEWKLTSASAYQGTAVGPDTLQVVVPGVVAGQVYDVRVRSVNRFRKPSAWLGDQHSIVGKTEKPEVPITFTVQRLADGTRRFEWAFAATPPADVRVGGGVQIRAFLGSTSDWSAMTPIHTGLLTNSPHETNELSAGIWTLAIKTVDSSGNESDTAVFINATLGNPRLREVLYQQDDKLLGWPGTKTDCFVAPENVLEALGAAGSTHADFESTTHLSLEATSWLAGLPRLSPIRYETEVIDLGADVTFTPQVSVEALGEVTIEMRSHSAAEGDDLSAEAWVALAKVEGERYVQVRVSVAGDTPVIETMLVLIDGETVIDDFEDINTASETAAWFESIAAGHFKLGIRKETAALSQAQLTALQNVGAGWSWELISKSATISGHPHPAAEFKVYNGAGTLADTTIDAQLKGPTGAALPDNLVGLAIEVEQALPITPQSETEVAVGQASETETARAITVERGVRLGQPSEIEAALAIAAVTTTYYVSAAGDDGNDGLTPATAWQTLAQVNDPSPAVYQAGDIIAFRRGDTFNDAILTPPTSGTAAERIKFAAYGSGADPIIDAQTVRNHALDVNGRDYLTFDRLDFRGTNGNTGSDVIRLEDADYITFTNCTGDGQQGGIGSYLTLRIGTSTAKCTNILLEDCAWKNGGAQTVGVAGASQGSGLGSDDITLRRCTFLNDVDPGGSLKSSHFTWLASGGQRGTLEDCTFESTFEHDGGCVNFKVGTGHNVIRCTFKSRSGSMTYVQNPNSAATSPSVTFTDCEWDARNHNGVNFTIDDDVVVVVNRGKMYGGVAGFTQSWNQIPRGVPTVTGYDVTFNACAFHLFAAAGSPRLFSINRTGDVKFFNCSFFQDNELTAIVRANTDFVGDITIRNSIMSGPNVDMTQDNPGGSFTLSHNLYNGNTNPGGTGSTTGDPNWASTTIANDNYLLPNSGSPAIDLGSDSYGPSNDLTNTAYGSPKNAGCRAGQAA